MPPTRKGVYGPRGDRSDEYTERKREYMREWRKRNPEKVREYNRKSYRNRRLHWKRSHGLGPAGYEELVRAQGGKCAICRGKFGERAPDIDHCHKSGRVRGLLCSACNTGIGKFGDSSDRLEAAAGYLRASVEQEVLRDLG